MILSKFNDNLPQMDEKELRTNKNAFEWWYFDIEDVEKEIKLVVQFKRRSPLYHKNDPLVYVEYSIPGAEDKLFLNYPIGEFSVEENDKGSTISIDRHYFRMVRDEKDMIKSIKVHVDFKDLKVDLDFIPLHQGFRMEKEKNYIYYRDDPIIGTSVNFAAPRVKGKGTFELLGKKYEIEGSGYHDHPWGTTTLLNTNRQWYWGRLYNDDMTIMYAKVSPHRDYKGGLNFFYHAKIDEFTPTIATEYEIIGEEWYKNIGGKVKYPHKLTIKVPSSASSSSIEVKADFISSIEEIMFYNRSEVEFNVNDNSKGKGWVEYVTVSAPRKLAGKLVQFQHGNIIKRSKETLDA